MNVLEYLLDTTLSSNLLDGYISRVGDTYRFDIIMLALCVVIPTILAINDKSFFVLCTWPILYFAFAKVYCFFNILFMYSILKDDFNAVYTATYQDALVPFSSMCLVFIWYFFRMYTNSSIRCSLFLYVAIGAFNIFVFNYVDTTVNSYILYGSTACWIIMVLSSKLETVSFCALIFGNAIIKLISFHMSELELSFKNLVATLGFDILFWILVGIPVYRLIHYSSTQIQIKRKISASTVNTEAIMSSNLDDIYQ